MEFYETIRTRRSARGYQPEKPVPNESLARIAEAIDLAPSACNRQPVKFLFVRNPELRAKICGVYQAAWLKEAPVIAVVLGCDEKAWHRLEGDSIVPVDAAIAMEHFMLAAAAEGLGTCWICAFRRDEMDKILGVAGSPWRSVAISPLGYAKAGAVGPLFRKNVQEMVQVID